VNRWLLASAFMLCAETCLRAESFLAADATAFELPLYD
jgi:hypothetical protein